MPGFPGGSVVKNPANAEEADSIPLRRKWQRTPGFLPGKSYGQRSLVGYSPWGHKKLDTTEQLSTNTHMHACQEVNKGEDFSLAAGP